LGTSYVSRLPAEADNVAKVRLPDKDAAAASDGVAHVVYAA
jgi:hypothetical protein